MNICNCEHNHVRWHLTKGVSEIGVCAVCEHIVYAESMNKGVYCRGQNGFPDYEKFFDELKERL